MGQAAVTTSDQPGAPLGRRRFALVLCGTTAGMLLLDIHKVSIAIPSIERALAPGPVGVQLISACYVLCFAVTLVPAGRAGDQGRRLALTYAGLYLYLAASVLCAVATSAAVLIAGRAVLGVAAGMLMPQVMGLVQQMFPPAERGRAFGVYGMCVSLATALGPSLGGLLTTSPELGWRGVFMMNVPIGLALVVAAHAILPFAGGEQRRPRGVVDVDLAGLALGSGAVIALLTPFVFTTGKPGDVSARWGTLVVAGVLGVWFVRHSRRRAAAGHSVVVAAHLLRIPSFRAGVLISLTWFASGPGFVLGLTIYLQQAEGFSPFLAGLVMLPSSATSVVGAWAGGRLVARRGRVLTATGMALALGCMATTLLVIHLAPSWVLLWAIPLVQLPQGLGAGLVVSPNHSMTLSDVPPGEGSAASAIGQLGQRIANSVGVAVASMAYYTVVYGGGYSLVDAPAAVHLAGLDHAASVASAFLVIALAVAVADLRRQRRTRVGELVLAAAGSR
jgi:MFS family permease